ncbi:methyl-accepting chemotaxis protein [Rhizobium sp. SL86]|uniref:methyl-accepting chemotaxis protein n=1 Tax=Rhizobium sp. SL86 TaxID=2995148 RepID=UPI002275821C|nr:methyl-accepting chemotaxis protein [Rhizobium sp. SL86]MCY1663967.1 methyl-accepting chemotaxis protein [Rhizobium sp. SL86]
MTILAAIAVAGLLAVAVIAVGQRRIEAQYLEAAEQLRQRETEVERLTAALRISLLAERNFLLQRDMAEVAAFGQATAQATDILSRLRTDAPAVAAPMLDELQRVILAYTDRFPALVKAKQDLGLTQDDGLEGAMRAAVHSTETALADVLDPTLQASMLMLRRHEKDFLLRGDPDYLDKHATEALRFKELVKAAIRPGAQRMRVVDKFSVYLNAFRLYAEGALKADAAAQSVTDAYAAIMPAVDALRTTLSAERETKQRENAAIEQRNTLLAAGLLGATILLLLTAVWLVGRSITRPIAAVTNAMRQLAGGDTDITVPGIGQRNEFGAMAAALEVFRVASITNRRLEEEAEAARRLAETERVRLQQEAEQDANARLAAATAGLAMGLERLAEGDLSFRLDEAFSPEFEGLRHNLNETLQRLAQVMHQIVEVSHALDGGSKEISVSADDLSRRTERQAAALEETAAALSQVTGNVSLSVRRIDEARHVAQETNEQTVRTGVLVEDAVSAMQRIEQSSKKIASIIGVIDEIAFQTNLLALNAGVEAARAGEAGKGFAVVAQEVRELAQRAGSASKEIRELIQTSGAEVVNGSRFVREVGAALADICTRVGSVDEHMQAIAQASSEQSQGLKEVNVAIGQMDQATQQNAAMVEENTAAAIVLAGEAQRLRDLMALFRLEGGLANTAQRSRAA